MHLLIGYLALRLAWEPREGGDADQTGALQTVADGPGGQRPALDDRPRHARARPLAGRRGAAVVARAARPRAPACAPPLVIAKCLAKALVYAVLGVTALLFAVGLEYEADERLQDLTDDTLDIPGGTALVVGRRDRR